MTVVLGAAADEAATLLEGADAHVAVAADWAEGMSASLRTGLGALDPQADAALVTLIDLPDVTADVVRPAWSPPRPGPACSPGRRTAASSGHPVLLGRDHWAGVVATATGDQGARDYLREREVTAVECGDLATGRDVDTPARTSGA